MELKLLSFPPVVIPAAALIYGLIHSLTASTGFKHLMYRLLGDWLKKYYRLLYSVISVLALLPVITLPILIPDEQLYTIPAPWVYLTGLVQIASIGLLAYSVIQTGALQFIGVPQALGQKTKEELNTGGLYQVVRHPLYTFSLLFLWLTPVMTRNLALLYGAFTVYILIGAIFEERKLLRTFGQDYAEYRRKTPFIIPYLV